MRRISIGLSRLALATTVAAGCAHELPTTATPVEAALARRESPAYTSTDIGALFDGSSRANSVNDAGEVVGWTWQGADWRAFAIVAGAATLLPGDQGNASGISNGSPRYVVGFAGTTTSQPVRWTIGDNTPSEPTNLALLADEVSGAALGVNDAGAAVGRAGNHAAMWSDAGIRTSVPAPEGYVRGEGRGINNAGDAVFVFFDGSAESAGARGYLRLASGVLVELLPVGGDVTSYANDISEVQDNAFYIAGTSRTSESVFRSVRWRVDATTGAILSTEVRAENSHTLAVSNDGAAAGFIEPNQANTLKFTAFLWRGTEFLSLRPPKGGQSGRAWASSPSGEFVVGDAAFGLTRHAVLWTILSP